ncbi:hypothetical protein F751_3172 [Auxenochlorella protothecoides]|uniref:Uncharacterized protein n=1 Tax=Auxenochlorella protothecoides TaxID=3075 RepID=A0A087SFF0_AUXPR|nr:hypothetical protein F751_3172 [Auxenochlorella protothecoides]KFM24454.1 hypothetical protein F751_3172 [Auxenochlorella protothecoides]RMZ54504.1 hypothetical protein APUTEX25_002080 [Auxenochlorella protothecoides]|eukprot:RMZ54504.1 hypothetical protein APUTEX25_002080 [Auxenochlorella protothecoides]
MPQIVLSHSPAKLHGIRDENARLVSHLTLKPLASASAFQADIATHDRVLDWAQTNCTLRRLRTEREVLAANLRMHRRIQAIVPSRDVARKQHAAAFEASRALVSQISAANHVASAPATQRHVP